jgi:hypothetical protein
MTELLVHVLVPYSTFLRYQDRRRKRAAELTWSDPPPTIAAEVPPVPVNQPPNARGLLPSH